MNPRLAPRTREIRTLGPALAGSRVFALARAVDAVVEEEGEEEPEETGSMAARG